MGVSNSWPEPLRLEKGRQCFENPDVISWENCFVLMSSLKCQFLKKKNLSTENIKPPADRFAIKSKHQFAKLLREPPSKFEILCGPRDGIHPPTETAHSWHSLVGLVRLSQEHGINQVCGLRESPGDFAFLPNEYHNKQTSESPCLCRNREGG